MTIKDKDFYSFEGFVKGGLKLLIASVLAICGFFLEKNYTAVSQLTISIVRLNDKLDEIDGKTRVNIVEIKEHGKDITDLKVRVSKIETRIEK